MRAEMEQARLIAFFSSKPHLVKPARLHDFGFFSWENEEDFLPKIVPVDKAVLEAFSKAEFKPYA